MQVTRETIIEDALKIDPVVERMFKVFGMHCINCTAAQKETIEEAGKVHKLTDETIEEMLSNINYILAERDKK